MKIFSKLLFLTAIFPLFLFSFPRTVSAQDIVRSVITIPLDWRAKISAQQKSEYKTAILEATRKVQDMYSNLLNGKTFVMNQDVAAEELVFPSFVVNYKIGVNPYDLLGKNIIGLDKGTVIVYWMIGADFTDRGFGAAGYSLNPDHGLVWMPHKALLDLLESEDTPSKKWALNALAHELGHAFGLNNAGYSKGHPCSEVSTNECIDKAPRPLPGGNEWASIMGYGAPYNNFPNLNFNNSIFNPEINKLYKSPFINPNNDPAPEPDAAAGVKYMPRSFFEFIKDGYIIAGDSFGLSHKSFFGDRPGKIEFWAPPDLTVALPSADYEVNKWDAESIGISIKKSAVSPTAESKWRMRITTADNKVFETSNDIIIRGKDFGKPKFLLLTAALSTTCGVDNKPISAQVDFSGKSDSKEVATSILTDPVTGKGEISLGIDNPQAGEQYKLSPVSIPGISDKPEDRILTIDPAEVALGGKYENINLHYSSCPQTCTALERQTSDGWENINDKTVDIPPGQNLSLRVKLSNEQDNKANVKWNIAGGAGKLSEDADTAIFTAPDKEGDIPQIYITFKDRGDNRDPETAHCIASFRVNSALNPTPTFQPSPSASTCPYSEDNCIYSDGDKCYSGHTDDTTTCTWINGTCLNPTAKCDYRCGPVECPKSGSASLNPTPYDNMNVSSETSKLMVSNYADFRTTNAFEDYGSPTFTVKNQPGKTIVWTPNTWESSPKKRIYIRTVNSENYKDYSLEMADKEVQDLSGIEGFDMKIRAKTIKKITKVTVSLNNQDIDINLNNPEDIHVQLPGTEGQAQTFSVPYAIEFSDGEVVRSAEGVDYQPENSKNSYTTCEKEIVTGFCNPPRANFNWNLQEAYDYSCHIIIENLTNGTKEEGDVECKGGTSREFIPNENGSPIGKNDAIRFTVSNGDPNGNCYNQSTEATVSCDTKNTCSEKGYLSCTPGQKYGTCNLNGKICTAYGKSACVYNGQDYCDTANLTCGEPCQPQPTATPLNCGIPREPYPQCGSDTGGCKNLPDAIDTSHTVIVIPKFDESCNLFYECEDKGELVGQCGNTGFDSACQYFKDGNNNCIYSEGDGNCYVGHLDDMSACKDENWVAGGNVCFNPPGCAYICGPVSCPYY